MQRKGGSIDRQQTLARSWCEEHNVELAETFTDEAVSGFHGDNLATGALSVFIARVKAGNIERGSYLLLENLDRLTRLSAWEASGLLQDLVKLGIVVITLRPEMRFDHTSDALDLLKAILHMDNAHKESARKSELGEREWAKRFARARDTKHHIGNRVSNWLTLDKPSGKYLVNAHAFAVGRIFELCLQGLGSTAISQALNAEGYRTFNKGGRWGTTAVLSILQNRAAIGELAPKDGGEPIPDYFTPVVDVATFDAAQAKIAERRTGKITKQSADFNVWQKLVVCGVCGSRMHIIQRTKFRYLTCANRRYGECEGARNVRLDESEDVFLLMLRELNALHFVMPDPKRISQELSAAEGRLQAEQKKLAIWVEKVANHPEVEAYHDLVIKGNGQVKALKAEIERLTAELAGSSDKLTLEEVRAKINMTDVDTRRRANAFLRRLGVQVQIADGYLVLQHDEARAMFAVDRNRIGCLGLEGRDKEVPDLQAANDLAAKVKTLLSTPDNVVYRGNVTVPNGRGTRRQKVISES